MYDIHSLYVDIREVYETRVADIGRCRSDKATMIYLDIQLYVYIREVKKTRVANIGRCRSDLPPSAVFPGTRRAPEKVEISHTDAMPCLIFSKQSHLNGVLPNIVYGSHRFSDLEPGASLVCQRWSSLHIGGHFYFAFP